MHLAVNLRALGEDKQLRAMVALIEAQAQQLESLRRAVRDLEGRLALRGELDVIVAHEVRTPLTVIDGALQTMLELEPGDPRFESLLGRAAGQAQHLVEVVKDLMEPQGHGGPAVNRAPLKTVTLNYIVDRALMAVSMRIALDRVAVDLPADLSVATSPPRLTAILVNLLDNAARYGGDGVLELRAEVTDDALLRIEIGDRGPGLGGVDVEELFEAFVQGPNGDNEGRGVGLYLVRLLARSLGGEVTLVDRPGGGCLATVELPQRRRDDPVQG
jgi:signal transduction histidine kinase